MTSADTTAAARRDRAAATNGETEAFEAAVRPHYAPSSDASCWSSATRTTPRTSPRTRTSRPSARGTGSTAADVRAWLYTIGLRLAFNHLPRPATLARGDRPDRAADLERPVRPGPVGRARDASTRGRARRCCSTSSTATPRPRSRGCWPCPEGTVASWISRGRAALRRELDPGR